MATTTTTGNVSISRTDSGYPAYLDFNTLRTNAINYLGPVTASYWTDYNVHDPGITTLEALLYALMDLGYRVNFPITDLLTAAPGTTDGTIDFLTPAQVLGGNPFTIVDYRKKLMDLTEVRNAWLDTGAATTGVRGVYSVYLELERDPADLGTEKEWDAYRDNVVREVKGLLQAHRNLCEDFAEPVVLVKKPVTMTADIELTDDAVPAEVYSALVKALYSFFSPVPTYYTLGQLVAMGIPLDTVFEGRPFDKWPSHGFILDADLPERPTGRTPIYLSAVYHQLLEIGGVRTVRKLTLDTGDVMEKGADAVETGVSVKGAQPVWIAALADDALPVFDIGGSRFNWFRAGQQLAVDLSAYTQTLQQEAIYAGKVFYPASELDVTIPQGRYLQGLNEYFSIQNDYPQVYGIGPGGLPLSATAERQSQALQFKGFLLFFDQLLADYLAQLGSIRELFSMGGIGGGRGPEIDPAGSGGGGSGGSTYFAGDVSSVPGLTPLLRFPAASAGAGTLLAYPVATPDWASGSLSCVQWQGLTPFAFTDVADRDTALAQAALLFSAGSPAVEYIPVDGSQVGYVISGVGNGFVLVSQSLFPDVATASKEVASVLYIGASEKNFSLSVLTGKDGDPVYSFSLVQTGASYYNYVQGLLESPEQFTQRRTAFLQHLIDRFAESFTDYALLSTGFLSPQEIASRQVGLMEQFLARFPALSGNRGQAFNYTRESWLTNNTSGLEKRVMAYSGIPDWRRRWLCHFEVAERDQQCQVAFSLEGKDWLVCPDSIAEKSAAAAAADLFRSMSNPENYRLLCRNSNRWAIGISFYGGYQALSADEWPDEVQAAAAADRWTKSRQLEPGEEDIEVNQFEYRAELLDAEGRVVRLSTIPFTDADAAWEDATKRVHHIGEVKSWQFDAEKDGGIGKLIRNPNESVVGEYLDMRGFDIAVKHDIPHKPEHCRFTVGDGEKTFRMDSTAQFANDSQGRAAAHALLFFLTEEANYVVYRDVEVGDYRLALQVEGMRLAVSGASFGDEAGAATYGVGIRTVLQSRLYHLRTTRVPLNWKFQFYTGLPGGALFVFRSDLPYSSVAAARGAMEDFYKTKKGWELRKTSTGYAVAAVGGKNICVLDTDAGVAVDEAGLQQSVQLKNTMQAMQAGDTATLNTLVRPDAASKAGGFVYRLTDKNRPRAFHPAEWKTMEEAAPVRETLIAKGRKGYRYLVICLDGDNVYFDGGGAAGERGSGWHFQIRCRNDYFMQLGLVSPDEWVLFESIAGYPTADAAHQAFQDSYLWIIEKAMDRINYGEKDIIAWDEQGRRKAVVFVPAALQEALRAAGLNVADELVKAAKAYPIRKGVDWEAGDRIAVDRGVGDREAGDRGVANREKRFGFQLVNDETGETDWESAGSFVSAQEAQVAFDYFRLLLNVSGNYFIDYDDKQCGYRLGIREVLAESANSFATTDAAWGPDGIEKFIGAAQTAGGFHPEKNKDGSWGYFIAAADVHPQHPCQYVSGEQRDEALQLLYTAAQGFPAQGWFSGTDWIVLNDPKSGKGVAQFPSAGAGSEVGIVLDMADAVWTGQFFEDDGGLYVPAGGGGMKVRPVERDISRDKWEEELLLCLAYFPVVRDASMYRLEMKLPGFAALPAPAGGDCGCPPEKTGKEPGCFAAWVGATPYTQAADAWKAYQALLPLLDELSAYRPVHAGPGEYGIELYKTEEIIAFGPQTYAYPEMASRGIGRAKDCINSEGMHLVEHLLLRPGKGGKTMIPQCPPMAGTLPGFTGQPGADPYSFLMTAFLPAWPERFRKKENRGILEKLLQEQAPAHILLRIVWLTPMDMCQWETEYKSWLRATTPQKPCGEYSIDRWIQLLFGEPLKCLDKDADEWLSEINLLYCWKDKECADTKGWTFDTLQSSVTSGGIQFKQNPNPMGQSVSTSGKAVVGDTVKATLAGKAEDALTKATDVAGKVDEVADKVQEAADKVHDASGKLQEVEKIVSEVAPIVEAIPGVGPVVQIGEEVIPVITKVGLWSKILHRGVDMMESLLNKLKSMIEQGNKK